MLGNVKVMMTNDDIKKDIQIHQEDKRAKRERGQGNVSDTN